MNLICDKCGGTDIYVVAPEIEEIKPRKMSEFNQVNSTPLIYKLTTVKCKGCGFSYSS